MLRGATRGEVHAISDASRYDATTESDADAYAW
jgi:hypothetical protein